MSSLAKYSKRGDIGVIAFDNPPINNFNQAVRSDILKRLYEALSDEDVEAVVIHGNGRCFSGGADIREIGCAKALTNPDPRDVIAVIDESPKPVVAAMHGVALGGGAELALGCHYRLCSQDAHIGFPEVTLGLLPGAGGTQRLPRLVGIAHALEMIVYGKSVSSGDALRMALVDQVVQGDLLDAAFSFARRIVAEKRLLPRASAVEITLSDAGAPIAAVRDTVGTSANPALLKCIDCIEGAARLSFEAGLRFERDQFVWLANSVESKALRYAFLAERAAAKVPDAAEASALKPIRQASVVGAGTMGTGIAMTFAAAGIPVALLDIEEAKLDSGLAAIADSYARMVNTGRLTQAERSRRLSLIRRAANFTDLRESDIVIEAAFEDMGVKQRVFAELDATVKGDAILATNTSTLDLNVIAEATSRPGVVIGTHFFSPAHVMRLLEIVRGAKTEQWVVASTLALAKRLQKVGVVAGVCDGFIGNRMIEEYLRQAYFLLEEGALPQQVDNALQNWGMAMGPFTMMDLAGNDIGCAIRKRRTQADPARQIYSQIPDLICDMGRFGQKTGAGFYQYRPGSRAPLSDPVIDQLIVDYSENMGIRRRAITDEEIVGRCILALVNEGAKIIEEGIALRASDVDVVYLAGYGFPRHRGGPMFYADTVGLAGIVAAMESFRNGTDQDERRQYWEPAALLTQLAAKGKTFKS